jgi:lipoprotein-anchoring transpeptidase ErfK/SrfK
MIFAAITMTAAGCGSGSDSAVGSGAGWNRDFTTTTKPTATTPSTTTAAPVATTAAPNTATTTATTTTAPPTTAPTTTTTAPTTTSTTASTTTSTTSTTTTAKPGTVDIDEGESGPQVVMLQEALKAVGFDVGTVDGEYGGSTKRAVWAFNALSGRGRSTVVTPDFLQALRDGWAPNPKRADLGPNRTEIDLSTQTLVIYENDKVRLITHVSSGSGEHYCEDAKSRVEGEPPPTLKNGEPREVCGDADTPEGDFEYGRRESKWYRSELGELYNPVFFNGGIAVHGARSVPDYPASHGCVRIPMHIAEYFQSLVKTGDPVAVFSS